MAIKANATAEAKTERAGCISNNSLYTREVYAQLFVSQVWQLSWNSEKSLQIQGEAFLPGLKVDETRLP